MRFHVDKFIVHTWAINLSLVVGSMFVDQSLSAFIHACSFLSYMHDLVISFLANYKPLINEPEISFLWLLIHLFTYRLTSYSHQRCC